MGLRFYIHKSELTGISSSRAYNHGVIDCGTSVTFYKQSLLTSLKRLGKIVPFDDVTQPKRLYSELAVPGTILVYIHNLLPIRALSREVKCRLLHLTLGSAMLPSLFLLPRAENAHLELVSTIWEKMLLINTELFSPQMVTVYPPMLDFGFWRPPTTEERIEARLALGITDSVTHILYAGRFVVSKGLCQLVRIFDRVKTADVILTLLGNFDPDARLLTASGTNRNFEAFFRSEIIQQHERSRLRISRSQDAEGLRRYLWSADAFAMPTIQPDENFNISSWQAAATGLPLVLTRVMGLVELASLMPWGGVDVYPSAGGIRFSLTEFGKKLSLACNSKDEHWRSGVRMFLNSKYSHQTAFENLHLSLEGLSRKTPGRILPPESVFSQMRSAIARNAPEIARWFAEQERSLSNAEESFFGDGFSNASWALISAIYCKSIPPEVDMTRAWEGFFRLKIWNEETRLVEFGFPGLRSKRYTAEDWLHINQCYALPAQAGPYFRPRVSYDCALLRDLVQAGYLVPF